MPQAHIHAAGPQYAPPLLREASPSESIATVYGPDTTDDDDKRLAPDEFARLVAQRLHLDLPLKHEEDANLDILIRPPRDQAEERGTSPPRALWPSPDAPRRKQYMCRSWRTCARASASSRRRQESRSTRTWSWSRSHAGSHPKR